MCDSAILAKRAGEFAAKGYPAPKIVGDYRRLLDSKDARHRQRRDARSLACKARDRFDGCGAPRLSGKADRHRPRRGRSADRRHSAAPGVSCRWATSSARARRRGSLSTWSGQANSATVYEAQTWYANNRGSIGNGQEIAPPANLELGSVAGPAPARTVPVEPGALQLALVLEIRDRRDLQQCDARARRRALGDGPDLSRPECRRTVDGASTAATIGRCTTRSRSTCLRRWPRDPLGRATAAMGCQTLRPRPRRAAARHQGVGHRRSQRVRAVRSGRKVDRGR